MITEQSDLQHWEEVADKEGLVGEDRKEWLKHCKLLHEAEGDEWYEETNWFLNRNFPIEPYVELTLEQLYDKVYGLKKLRWH